MSSVPGAGGGDRDRDRAAATQAAHLCSSRAFLPAQTRVKITGAKTAAFYSARCPAGGAGAVPRAARRAPPRPHRARAAPPAPSPARAGPSPAGLQGSGRRCCRSVLVPSARCCPPGAPGTPRDTHLDGGTSSGAAAAPNRGGPAAGPGVGPGAISVRSRCQSRCDPGVILVLVPVRSRCQTRCDAGVSPGMIPVLVPVRSRCGSRCLIPV